MGYGRNVMFSVRLEMKYKNVSPHSGKLSLEMSPGKCLEGRTGCMDVMVMAVVK